MSLKEKIIHNSANLSWIENLKDKDKLWITVDDVFSILDEATKQINEILLNDDWTLDRDRKKVLAVLDGEKKERVERVEGHC